MDRRSTGASLRACAQEHSGICRYRQSSHEARSGSRRPSPAFVKPDDLPGSNLHINYWTVFHRSIWSFLPTTHLAASPIGFTFRRFSIHQAKALQKMENMDIQVSCAVSDRNGLEYLFVHGCDPGFGHRLRSRNPATSCHCRHRWREHLNDPVTAGHAGFVLPAEKARTLIQAGRTVSKKH